MIRRLSLLSLLALIAWGLTGCDDFDSKLDYSDNSEPEVVESHRTLLVYMAFDNSLNTISLDNINSLLAGATPASMNNGRVVIYRDIPSAKPLLMEIKLSDTGSYLDTIKIYNVHNSATPAVLREVLDDVKSLAPSTNYAIDIGSHATGWLPSPNAPALSGLLKAQSFPGWATPAEGEELRPASRTTMMDGSTNMELQNLAAALHDNEFEYIMFDACYMGGVESIYELRNKAKHIIASPAEVIVEGMPYRLILGDLMATDARLESACRKYYEYYAGKLLQSYRSATIGLYDCSKMEALAEAMEPINTRFINEIPTMQTSVLQYFDTRTLHTMFDMADFVAKLIPNSSDPMRTAFTNALNNVVIYKAATEKIMNTIPVTTYCGISTYVPTNAMGASLNNYYKLTAWQKRVY